MVGSKFWENCKGVIKVVWGLSKVVGASSKVVGGSSKAVGGGGKNLVGGVKIWENIRRIIESGSVGSSKGVGRVQIWGKW